MRIVRTAETGLCVWEAWPVVWTLVLGTDSGRLQNCCWIQGKVNTGLSTTHTSVEGKSRLKDPSVDSLCPAQDSLLCLWEEEPLKRVTRDSVHWMWLGYFLTVVLARYLFNDADTTEVCHFTEMFRKAQLYV